MTQEKLKFFSDRGLQYLDAVWLGKKNWKYVKDDLQYIIAELRKYEVMLEKKNVTMKSAARSPIADSQVYIPPPKLAGIDDLMSDEIYKPVLVSDQVNVET